MRLAKWIDADGRKRQAWVKDGTPVSEVESAGIYAGPPDIDLIDWESVKRDLHNQLVERGLFSMDDVVAAQTGITGAVLTALRNRVARLYKQEVE